MSATEQPPLPCDEYDRNITALERKVEAHQLGLEQAAKKLAWWQEGRALYFGDGVPADQDSAGDTNASGEASDGTSAEEDAARAALANGKTLRHVILGVFFDRRPINGSEPIWTAPEIIAELKKRDA